MGGRTTAADEGGGEAPLVVSVVPNEKAAPFKPGQGVASAASTADVGELFQYAIRSPVTLNRQQSAMLPIVNESVKGEKLAIYDPKVHSKHPLDGLRLANTTGLHLMQGPITVFDGGVFAGNARIHDLAPDGERLISYALDLDTEVTAEPDALGERLVAVRIAEGVVQTEHKSRRTQKYTIRNSGRREKKLLIEYPRDYEWTLVAPEKPAEQTRDRYRFAVAAEPGKPAMLSVVEERIDRRKVAIKELDDRVVQAYLDAKQVSAEVKAALAKIVAQKQSIARTEGQRALLEKQLAAIEREQSRIRENMARLDRNSDLYNRYVKKFGEQEDEIDKLRSQVKSLSEQESTQRQLLAELVENLTVE